MTVVQVSLPDELARKALKSGVLEPTALEAIIQAAVERAEKRSRFIEDLERIHAGSGGPMPMEEIVELVKEVRKEIREEQLAAGR